jgi:hypothetical protein
MKSVPESRTKTKRMNQQLPAACAENKSYQAEKNSQNEPVVIGFFEIACNSSEVDFPEGQP